MKRLYLVNTRALKTVKQLYLVHIRTTKTVKQLYLVDIRELKRVKQLYLVLIRAIKTVKQPFRAKPSPCRGYGRGEAYTGFWWENLRERDHLGDPRRRWDDNIKMNLQEMGCDGMDWIELSQDRDRWRALVNEIMNVWLL